MKQKECRRRELASLFIIISTAEMTAPAAASAPLKLPLEMIVSESRAAKVSSVHAALAFCSRLTYAHSCTRSTSLMVAR